MHFRKLFILCFTTLFFVHSISAQVAKKDAALVEEPKSKKEIGKIKKGDKLKVLQRKGFWYEIESGGKKGWVKATKIKFNKKSGSVALDTGRLGKGNIVSTSAARGLSAKDLVSGEPNTKELGKFSQFIATDSDISTFTSVGKLQPVKDKIVLRAPAVEKPKEAKKETGKVKKNTKEVVEEESDDEW